MSGSEALREIRQIAPAPRGAVVALAEFEDQVEVWRTEPAVSIARLRTILDFGGQRLAVMPAGDLLFAARFSGKNAGVACYEVDTGELRWHRADVRHPQKLCLSPDGGRLYCCVEEGPCQVLDPLMGHTRDRLRDVQTVFAADDSQMLLLSGRRTRVVAGGEQRFAIDTESFALLAATFSSSLLCISESGGSVRTFSLESGDHIWRYDPPNGCHVLDVGHSALADAFFGVQWSFQDGGDRLLLRFDGEAGTATVVRSLGPVAESMIAGQPGLVFCSDRSCYRLIDGTRIGEFTAA